MDNILLEIKTMWKLQNKESISDFVDKLCFHLDNNIVGVAAGRMGYSLRAFIMRLSHMNYYSYMIGDTNLPKIGKNDMIIVNSSSGNTPTNVLYAQQAKKEDSLIFSITTDKDSKIATLSDCHLLIPKINSQLLMKSIYEQYTYLLLDYIITLIIEKNKLSFQSISSNHSILE